MGAMASLWILGPEDRAQLRSVEVRAGSVGRVVGVLLGPGAQAQTWTDDARAMTERGCRKAARRSPLEVVAMCQL